MTERTSPPTWYWIVATIALIWNGLGVMAYLMQVYMTPEQLAMLPEAEQALYENVPTWVTAAFAIAVFGGTLGCLLLLLRKGLSQLILMISLVAIIAQMVYNLLMSKAMEVYGPGGAIMPIMTILVAIGLVWLAKSAKAKGWMS